ncbi:uncharacterized protein LOC107868382 [Capsicum annuum]|uniref:uncharacterized protein LOC107868382 n=1 Tax=Capsicum annuum TaxID=4072 RepID=UPI001FB09907|nr:uncharacterized protein LOC107868382 [Capsicum annuum]
MSHALHSRGYYHSLNDYFLFTRGSGSSLVLLTVYVDDIILTGTDLEEISNLKLFLHDQFKIKDLGLLHYFLGIEVFYSGSGILLHQSKFIHDLLKEYHCDTSSSLPQPDKYRSLLGKFNFLTHTRPDMSFTVQHLSQFMQHPCVPHMKAVIHLCAISGALLLLVCLCRFIVIVIGPYALIVDGFCVLFGGSLISWKAKNKPVVSLSLAESEYRSVSKAVGEITWLSHLVSDFWLSSSLPIPVFYDNQSAIHISKNSVFHELTKHIELDCHFVRTKFGNGLISLHHTPSSSELADIFTKILPCAAHHSHLLKLGVLSTSNLRGVLRLLYIETYKELGQV